MSHIYERELTTANGQGLTFPQGAYRRLFPIGLPPAGHLLHLAVHESTGNTSGPAYTARLYNRNIGVYLPVATYATNGSVVQNPGQPYMPGQAAVANTNTLSVTWPTAATLTFGTACQGLPTIPGGTNPFAFAPTYGYKTMRTFTRTDASFVGDLMWAYGGMLPLYPGNQNVVSGLTFTWSSGNSNYTLAPSANIPVDRSCYNPGSLYAYYLPTDTEEAVVNLRKAVIVDENTMAGDGEVALQISANDGNIGGTAWYSDGHGKPYMNREGSISVPVRQVYLDIDFGATVASQPWLFEVDIAIEVGDELN
jgi:hypothetical protein